MGTTKYKAIQPLVCMELQRFCKKVKLYKLTYVLVKNTKYKAWSMWYGVTQIKQEEKQQSLAFPHSHTHLKQSLY